MSARRPGWCVAALAGLGIGLAALYWGSFSGPFPLSEFCARRHPTWVLPLLERPRYTAVSGIAYLSTMVLATLAYLAAVYLAVGVRGRAVAALLLALMPLLFAVVLVPGYPLLSSDIFKYVFDGRILAIYRQNPFVHVPAEFPDDRFYDLVYWKAVVNAHGPLWRLAEGAASLIGGESCRNAVLAMKAWPSLAYLGTTGAMY